MMASMVFMSPPPGPTIPILPIESAIMNLLILNQFFSFTFTFFSAFLITHHGCMVKTAESKFIVNFMTNLLTITAKCPGSGNNGEITHRMSRTLLVPPHLYQDFIDTCRMFRFYPFRYKLP